MKQNKTEHSGKSASKQEVADKQLGTAMPESLQTTSAEASAEEFDRGVLEKLSSIAPLPPSNWRLMSEKLDLVEERIRFLYRHKLLESAIFLLLLFSVQNLLEFTGTDRSAASQNVALATEKGTLIGFVQPKKHATKPFENARELGRKIFSKTEKKSELVAVVEKRDESIKMEAFAAESSQSSELNAVIDAAAAEKCMPMPGLQTKEIVVPEKPSTTFLKPAVVKKRSSHFAVAIVSALNINQVHTPSEIFQGRNIDAYDQFTVGAGGGFLLSRESKKMAIESGLIYLSKHYRPQHIGTTGLVSNGFLFRETLNRFQANVLELPLNIRFKKKTGSDRWTFYGGLGASLNLFTKLNYDFEKQYFVSVSALSGLGSAPTTSELRKVKDFNPGLFEGGGFRENAHLSAQAMMGFEYKISPKYSFFNQLGIQRQIDSGGVGANGNLFHAFTWWIGLKTHFN